MGIVKLPNRRMYWAPDTRNEHIAESMTRYRFDEITMVLHFNDNNAMQDKDSPLFNGGDFFVSVKVFPFQK